MRLDPSAYRVLLERGMDTGITDRIHIAQPLETGGLVIYEDPRHGPSGVLRTLHLAPAKTTPGPDTFTLDVSGSKVWDPVREDSFGFTNNASGVNGLSIQWGDGLDDSYSAPFDQTISHAYLASGTFRIQVTATMENAQTWTTPQIYAQWWPSAYREFTAVVGA